MLSRRATAALGHVDRISRHGRPQQKSARSSLTDSMTVAHSTTDRDGENVGYSRPKHKRNHARPRNPGSPIGLPRRPGTGKLPLSPPREADSRTPTIGVSIGRQTESDVRQTSEGAEAARTGERQARGAPGAARGKGGRDQTRAIPVGSRRTARRGLASRGSLPRLTGPRVPPRPPVGARNRDLVGNASVTAARSSPSGLPGWAPRTGTRSADLPAPRTSGASRRE